MAVQTGIKVQVLQGQLRETGSDIFLLVGSGAILGSESIPFASRGQALIPERNGLGSLDECESIALNNPSQVLARLRRDREA